MKQKNTAIGKAFLCGGAAMLLLAGCVKESAINEKYRPAGTPITFSAATGYENGTGTRTEYSGQLYGNTPKYERIDWLSGDPVTITYVHGTPATSQYQVTEVSGTTDKNSLASVEVASGQTKLTWGEGEGDHTFYAMYPSTGFQGNGSASLTSSNHVQGSVPATQTLHLKSGKYLPPMQYGYMVAYKNIGGTSTESRVTLPFTPAVTAFEFKLQKRNGDTGNLKIKGAELTATTPLTGTFAFDITGGDDNGATWNTSIGTNATTVTNGGHTVSFTFPVEGGVSLPDYDGETFLDFTVFALPVEQTGLRLKLIYMDDSENVLALNDAPDVPHIFEAAKKHVITNKSVPGDWEYVIEATDPDIFPYTGGTKNATVTSYRQKGNVKEPVAWTVEGYYYDAACTQPVAPADLWITSFNGDGTGEGSVTGATVPVVGQASVPVVTETITPEAQALNALIANAPSQGSAGNYMNLSNPMDMTSPYIKESANSYIVNATGYYRIPLVMGNSIKNNAPNPDEIAWKGYDGREDDGMGNLIYKNDWRVLFENYKGNHITDPWLKNQGGTPTSAEIVWEDVEGLVETDDAYNLQNAISADGNWLQFRIPTERSGAGIINGQNEPRQGNAVIAVKDETGTVMWSYHIWVTDYIPRNYSNYSETNDVTFSSPVKYYDNTINVSFDVIDRFMDRNLGFTIYGQEIKTYYSAHPVIYLKIVQVGGNSANVVKLMVQQEDHLKTYLRDMAHPTYYYGRITPLWPTDSAHPENDWAWYGKSPCFSSIEGALTLSESIRNPGCFVIGKPGSLGTKIQDIPVSKPDDIVYMVDFDPTYDNSSVAGYLYKRNWEPTTHMPINLWNASQRIPFPNETRADPENFGYLVYRHGEDHSIMWNSCYNFNKAKTVYDPCPVGYVVPSCTSYFTYRPYSKNTTLGLTIEDGSIINVQENTKYIKMSRSSYPTSILTFPRISGINSSGRHVTNRAFISLTNIGSWSSSSPLGVSSGHHYEYGGRITFNSKFSASCPIRPCDDIQHFNTALIPTKPTKVSELFALVP